MRRSRVLAGIALTAMLVVAGCGGGGGEAEGVTQAARQRTTRLPSGPPRTSPIGWRPSKRSWRPGLRSQARTVKLVAIAEDQLTTVLTSAAAANDLPDAIAALSLNGMNQLRTDDLVDPEAAKEIVDGLGR